jgi:Zn finger protein HypA/HybF involved in hydrogenase expression
MHRANQGRSVRAELAAESLGVPGNISCSECDEALRNDRARYCSPACRQAAYRRRVRQAAERGRSSLCQLRSGLLRLGRPDRQTGTPSRSAPPSGPPQRPAAFVGAGFRSYERILTPWDGAVQDHHAATDVRSVDGGRDAAQPEPGGSLRSPTSHQVTRPAPSNGKDDQSRDVRETTCARGGHPVHVDEQRFPCPCCGHVVFSAEPGSDDICPICFWQDDVVQLRWPDFAGGANRPSLIDAQAIYQRIGAAEERLLPFVRMPRASERLDTEWRPFDPSRDVVEAHISGVDSGKTYERDRTRYYYWRERGA